MPAHRRLTAAFGAFALGWVGIVVLDAPVAQAAPGHRAPHDPATYYAGTEGLSGQALATKLNTIIDGHTQLSYGDVYDALPFTDEDPANSDNLIVFYSGTSLDKDSRCGAGSCAGLWNREHSWPQSHGGIGTSGPGADLFHMRPEFADTNSSRGNKDFDNGGTANVPSCAPCLSTQNSFEPRAAVKGDLARGLFYMAVRYNGDADDGFGGDLELGESIPTSGPSLGRLSTLAAWSLADPPDDLERARNDLIDETYQHNRNPFIDHPEWVCSIWGSQVGTVCSSSNSAPTTSSMTATTAEDTATTVSLTASDADGDPLTWSITQPAVHGTAGIVGSTLTYTPASNFHDTDTIGVSVSDGRGGVSTATVTITVTPVNDAPTASPMTKSTAEDTATTVSLTASDADGDPLTWQVSAQPPHGAASVAGSTLSYLPAADFHGGDVVGLTVSDGHGGSASATVTMTVAPVNDAPVAHEVLAATTRNTARQITLAGSDVDDTTLTYAVDDQPGHGTVSITGVVATYTPAHGHFGDDSFSYVVTDASNAVSAPATVTVAITANEPPAVTAVTTTTPEEHPVTLTLTASDPNGDPLTYGIESQPAHGTLQRTGNQVTYTPEAQFHGTDSFTWSAGDGDTTASSSATIVVTPVNDGPTVTGTLLRTTAGTPVSATLGTMDPDGDGVTITAATAPAHGSLTFSGATVTYTPAIRSGADTFLVTVSDGNGGTAQAQVGVEITALTAHLQLSTPSATRGTTVVTAVSATSPSGAVPAGSVTLSSGGTTLGTATLRPDGTASVPWTPALAGVTSLVASYAGDARFTPTSSPPVPVTVARATSKLKIAGSLKSGRPGVVTVKVITVAGFPATGKVTLKVGSTRLTAKLKNGVAKLRILELPSSASLKVKASYPGDGQYTGGSVKRTLQLRR